MNMRLGETLVGLAVLVAAILICFWAFVGGPMVLGTADGPGYRLFADFDDASGLRPGTVVEIAGVPVGQVTGLTLNEYSQARVEMRVQPNVLIPEEAELAWRQSDLLGAPRLSILIFDMVEPYLSDGDFFSVVDPADNFFELLSNLAQGAGGT